MSIETRVSPFSRSIRSLIRKHADLAKTIKDLKDLRALRVCACYRHSGPTDLKRTRDVFSVARTMARETRSHARVASEGPRPTVKCRFFSRSAVAYPPRALECADDIKTGRTLLHRFMKHPPRISRNNKHATTAHAHLRRGLFMHQPTLSNALRQDEKNVY